jgi:hypothetical protein
MKRVTTVSLALSLVSPGIAYELHHHQKGKAHNIAQRDGVFYRWFGPEPLKAASKQVFIFLAVFFIFVRFCGIL